MAELEYVKLSDSDVQGRLSALDGWSVANGKLVKTFKFGAYMDGVEFAGKVGKEADYLNHHPDILIGYQNVVISVNTHDVGGISPYDFELARLIELI